MRLQLPKDQIVDRIIDILNTYGWVQGSYGDYDVGFCLSGAAQQAERELNCQCICLEITEYIRGKTDRSGMPHWNDSSCIDKDDAIRLLKEFKDEISG